MKEIAASFFTSASVLVSLDFETFNCQFCFCKSIDNKYMYNIVLLFTIFDHTICINTFIII